MIIAAFKYLLIFIAVFAVFVFAMDRLFRSQAYEGDITDHFDGKQFINLGHPLIDTDERSRWSVLKWMFTRDKQIWTKRQVEQTKPAMRIEGSRIVATFINHASVLIQTEGLNILTDPIYSERASPVQFAGPKRYQDPGVAFDDLPPIDIVLISHNHYDHMDLETLKRLKDRFDPVIIVTLGNEKYLKDKGITANELDWWSVYGLDGQVAIIPVPAQHFSARAISDRNKTLWGGYAIRTPHGDIYFSGDTGYGPFIEEIRTRFPGGFRFGIVPIGAFRPEWMMREVHTGPEDALRMVEELSIKEAMAIHFGTFKLADDGQDEATTTLSSVSKDREISVLRALRNGESMEIE